MITGGEQICRHLADKGVATGCQSKLRISVLVPKRVHGLVEAVARPNCGSILVFSPHFFTQISGEARGTMLHKGRHSKHIFNIFDKFRIYLALTLASGKNNSRIKCAQSGPFEILLAWKIHVKDKGPSKWSQTTIFFNCYLSNIQDSWFFNIFLLDAYFYKMVIRMNRHQDEIGQTKQTKILSKLSHTIILIIRLGP